MTGRATPAMNETIRLILDRIQGCRRCADCGRFDDWLMEDKSWICHSCGHVEFPANTQNEVRYEFVRRSGRLVGLPWIAWRFLPRSRRRVVAISPQDAISDAVTPEAVDSASGLMAHDDFPDQESKS